MNVNPNVLPVVEWTKCLQNGVVGFEEAGVSQGVYGQMIQGNFKKVRVLHGSPLGAVCLVVIASRNNGNKLSDEDRGKCETFFEREINVWQEVQQWNSDLFAKVYAIVKYNGKSGGERSGLLMRYYIRGDLFSAIEKGPTVAMRHFYARQVVDILRLFHDHNAVWKDLKEENLLLSDDGTRLKIIDLSFAVLNLGEPANLLEAREFNGTLPKIPPELVSDKDEEDPRLYDIFAAGVTMLGMGLISRPDLRKRINKTIKRLDEIETVEARVWEIISSCARRLRHSGDPLAKILGQMMYLDPKQRPNAVKVQEAFAQIPPIQVA